MVPATQCAEGCEYRIRCNTQNTICHTITYRHVNCVAGERLSATVLKPWPSMVCAIRWQCAARHEKLGAAEMWLYDIRRGERPLIRVVR